MKKDRLLKNSFLVRLLGLLMAFFFLSAFTAPEKPDYGIYDPNHYLTEEVVTQIRDLNEANSQKAEKLQIGVYIVDSLEGESIKRWLMKPLGHGRLAIQEIILEV